MYELPDQERQGGSDADGVRRKKRPLEEAAGERNLQKAKNEPSSSSSSASSSSYSSSTTDETPTWSGEEVSPSPPPPPSPAKPPSPPPPAAPAPPTWWCWNCRIRPAMPVDDPMSHLCVCPICFDAGHTGCPTCKASVRLLSTPTSDDDAVDQESTFLTLLSTCGSFHLSDSTFEGPSTNDIFKLDVSDPRNLPLLHLHRTRQRCDDCRRPAVWIASCCASLLCSGCLAMGYLRRHGPCRSQGAIGLVAGAGITTDELDADMYCHREVLFSLKERVGSDFG